MTIRTNSGCSFLGKLATGWTWFCFHNFDEMVQLRQRAKLKVHIGSVDMKNWEPHVQHRHWSSRNVIRS